MTYIHISMGGPDRKIVDEAGKEIAFEDHPRFGPMTIDKRGDIHHNQPGERASFWRVYAWWCEQGKIIDAAGLCTWVKPPEQKMVHLGGRHWKAVYE